MMNCLAYISDRVWQMHVAKARPIFGLDGIYIPLGRAGQQACYMPGIWMMGEVLAGTGYMSRMMTHHGFPTNLDEDL